MKPPKKLKINKITLRDLDDSERYAIAGGAGPSDEFTACATCFSCPTRCRTCVACG